MPLLAPNPGDATAFLSHPLVLEAATLKPSMRLPMGWVRDRSTAKIDFYTRAFQAHGKFVDSVSITKTSDLKRVAGNMSMEG